jgi:hypothetical protein
VFGSQRVDHRASLRLKPARAVADSP